MYRVNGCGLGDPLRPNEGGAESKESTGLSHCFFWEGRTDFFLDHALIILFTRGLLEVGEVEAENEEIKSY